MFSHSPASKLRWRTTAGESIAPYSTTRRSWREILKQLRRLFHRVQPFLQSLESSPTVPVSIECQSMCQVKNIGLKVALLFAVAGHSKSFFTTELIFFSVDVFVRQELDLTFSGPKFISIQFRKFLMILGYVLPIARLFLELVVVECLDGALFCNGLKSAVKATSCENFMGLHSPDVFCILLCRYI